MMLSLLGMLTIIQIIVDAEFIYGKIESKPTVHETS